MRFPWLIIGTIGGLFVYAIIPHVEHVRDMRLPPPRLYYPLYFAGAGMAAGLAIDVGIAVRRGLRRPRRP